LCVDFREHERIRLGRRSDEQVSTEEFTKFLVEWQESRSV
jgi:hypothetical protein